MMAHSFVNNFNHIMWSTKNQAYTFSESIKDELLAYATSLVKSKNGKVIFTGGFKDHVHLLIMQPAEITLSALMSHIKANTSKWIKTKNDIDPKFTWQEGFLAISTQSERLDEVCNYIRSDASRHQRKTYAQELEDILKQQNIPYTEYFLSSSFSKIYVHLIWSTNNRKPLLQKTIRQNLFDHISNILSGHQTFVHAINGMEDHIHLLIEQPKNKSISELMQEIKTSSTHWLKSFEKKMDPDFYWQTGFGAFSVSLSNLEIVTNYIHKQEEHHRYKTPQEEWNDFILKNGYGIYL